MYTYSGAGNGTTVSVDRSSGAVSVHVMLESGKALEVKCGVGDTWSVERDSGDVEAAKGR